MGPAWHFRKKKAGSEKTPPVLFIKLDTHNRYVNQSYILTKSDYNVYPRKPRDTQIQQDHSFINALKGVLLREHAENETSFSCTV